MDLKIGVISVVMIFFFFHLFLPQIKIVVYNYPEMTGLVLLAETKIVFAHNSTFLVFSNINHVD